MAINWTFSKEDYIENDFSPIPEGDHRVRIANVEEKVFKSGNEGFEITFDVSGRSGKLWHYLVLKRDDPKKTNQSIGSFFESFGITDYDLNHYRNWVGKVGAVRVRHEDYNGSTSAKVAFCLSKKNQEKLAPAKFSDAAPASSGFVPLTSADLDALPF